MNGHYSLVRNSFLRAPVSITASPRNLIHKGLSGVAFLLCFHNFRPLSSILSRDTQSSKVLLVSTFDLSHMITSSSLWKIPHLNYPLIVYKYSKVEVSPKLKFNHYQVTLVSMERRVKAASFAQGCLDNGCVFILEWTIPYRLHE